jgi:O-antigen/teichoic acid export membrane protein
MTIGGTLVAKSFIAQIYPEYYPASVPVLIILVWALPCIFGNFLLGTVLNAIDRQTKNFHASAWALASNFLLNIPGILFFGARGAAAATILSQGLYLMIILYHCRDVIEWRIDDVYRCLGMLAAAAVMAVLLILLPLGWLWETLIGAGSYAVGSLLFRGVIREDIELVFSMRRR